MNLERLQEIEMIDPTRLPPWRQETFSLPVVSPGSLFLKLLIAGTRGTIHNSCVLSGPDVGCSLPPWRQETFSLMEIQPGREMAVEKAEAVWSTSDILSPRW
jgi:hypothetical protein